MRPGLLTHTNLHDLDISETGIYNHWTPSKTEIEYNKKIV